MLLSLSLSLHFILIVFIRHVAFRIFYFYMCFYVLLQKPLKMDHVKVTEGSDNNSVVKIYPFFQPKILFTSSLQVQAKQLWIQ